MNPVITIKCTVWDTPTTERINSFLSQIVANALSIEILPPSLTEIIVTDSYLSEHNKIAELFNMSSKLKNENEYQSCIKLCYNQKDESNTSILLIDASIFCSEEYVDQINRIFLEDISSELLPQELNDKNVYYSNSPVSDIAKVFFPGLFASLYAQLRLQVENRANTVPPLAIEKITVAFKRKVKRLHLEYQKWRRLQLLRN